MIRSKNQLDNDPIAAFEYQHLNAHEPQGNSRRLYVLGAGVVVSIALAAWLLFIALTDRETFMTLRTQPGDLGDVIVVLCMLTLIYHFMLMAQVLYLPARSPGYRGSDAWPLVVTSGMSARQIVHAKWRVALRLTWQRYLVLFLLRIGVTVGGGVLIVGGMDSIFLVGAFPHENAAINMLVAIVFVGLMTMANWLFTCAAAVAGSMFNKGTSPVLSSGFSTRGSAIMVIGVPLLIVMTALLLSAPDVATAEEFTDFRLGSPLGIITQLSIVIIVSLFDNGTLAMMGVANPFDQMVRAWVIGLVLTLIVYAVLTYVMLRVAAATARRQGLIP